MRKIIGQSLHIIEQFKLSDILDEMAETGANRIAMSLESGGNAVAAVVVIRGEETQALLDALDKASETLPERAEA